MKKFSFIFFAVLMMMFFVSCEEVHEHTWGKSWEYGTSLDSDYGYHWRACEDPNCSEVYQKELHQWLYDDASTEGLKDNEKKKYCSICGMTMIEQQLTVDKSEYLVSEEEWESALNMEELPSVIKQHVYYPDHITNNGDELIYYSVVEIGENIVYKYELDENLTDKRFEYCYTKEGDSYYRYRLDYSTNKWVSESSSESSYNHAMTDYVSGLANIFHYEDFDFNLNDNSYMCETAQMEVGEDATTLYNIVLKFNNGRLQSYYFEAEIDGYNCAYTVFEYDDTKVNLPNVKN